MIVDTIVQWDIGFIEEFVKFKNSIYCHHKDYIPEEIIEFEQMLQLEAPFNCNNKWQAWLIRNEDNKNIIGRVFCSTRTNKFKQNDFLPFGYFEALNYEAAKKLIELVEDFARNEKYPNIRGPIQGNVFNSSRFQIRQDKKPFLTEPMHKSEYLQYFSELGLKQNEFWISTEYGFWSRMKSINDVFITRKPMKFKKRDYQFRQLNKEKWDGECKVFYELLMDSFREMKDVELITFDEFKVWIDRLKPIIHPKNCIILQHQGEDAAFICALSDLRPELAQLARHESWWQKFKFFLKFEHSFGRILVLYLGKKTDCGDQIPKAGPALCKVLAKNNRYFLFNNVVFGYMNPGSKSLAVTPDHYRVISEYATFQKELT